MSKVIHTSETISDWIGYLTRPELATLKLYSSALSFYRPVIVNIGAGAGTSSIGMAEANPDAIIFSVDILTTESPATTNEYLRMDEIDPKVAERIIRIWGDSHIVGKTFPYWIDALFVDGDHSYRGCYEDLLLWTPRVKLGGWVGVHDYNRDIWPDVKIATDDYINFNKYSMDKLVDTLFIFKV